MQMTSPSKLVWVDATDAYEANATLIIYMSMFTKSSKYTFVYNVFIFLHQSRKGLFNDYWTEPIEMHRQKNQYHTPPPVSHISTVAYSYSLESAQWCDMIK